MNSKDLRELCEAYSEIYEDEFESWVNSLLDEGYDLSDYTWDEMYEAYLDEAPMTDFQAGGGNSALPSSVSRLSPRSSRRQVATQSIASRGRDNLFRAGGGAAAMSNANARLSPRSGLRATRASVIERGRTASLSKPTNTPTPSPNSPPSPNTKPASAGSGSISAGALKPKTSPTPTGGQTGNKAKDMQTWAKANRTLAASAAERERTRGTSSTTNPLMQDFKSRLPAPKTLSPTTTATAFNKSTPALATPRPTGAASNLGSTNISPTTSSTAFSKSTPNLTDMKKQTVKSSYEWGWGSASKLVDDIADAYQSVYEAKKVDQDKDGDNDFEDVQIARMIASGVPKEEAIRRVRGKSYNEEYELDEATRMRKELGKEGETATRKELEARSRAHQRSGSVDRTIAAAKRAADRTVPSHRDESESDYNKRMRERSQTYTRLASSRRGSVRDKPRAGLRGYAASVSGDDKDLQRSRESAMAAGTLTPAEKKKLGEDFELWINKLLDEGYDLSEYTLDEMFEIYEETDEEKRRNERRARIAELQASGRVMTSSKRTSARAKERREEQKAERLERLANQALEATRGATRRSSKPMGSTPPEPKPAAPSGEEARRLPTGEKTDQLHKLVKQVQRGSSGKKPSLDDLLSQIKNEDFVLWIDELLDEGYDLSDYTLDEMVEIYEENMKKSPRNVEKAKQKAQERKTRRLRIQYYGKDVVGHGTGKGLKPTQNEDFVLWIDELLDEGYELKNWTDEELYDLYEEILEEKYSR